MRVAVVGCGSIGKRHIANLLALGCEVTAIDVRAAAFDGLPPSVRTWAAEWEGTGDISPVMDFDAIVIATPWDQHLTGVERAVAFGIPFLVEKPLGSLEQLSRWRALCAGPLPVNQIGYSLRFQEKAQWLGRAFAPVQRIDCLLDTDMRKWPGRAYGPFLLECSHEIDLALWCGAGALTAATLGTTTAALTFEHGKVSIAAKAPQYLREWSGLGEWAGFHCRFESSEELGTDAYRHEMIHFLDCVREQKPTRVPISEGVKVLEVCAQAEALSKRSA